MPRHARVYFRRDGKKVLIATVHCTPKGMPVDGEGPLALSTWDDEALGESLQSAFERSATVPGELKPSQLPQEASLKVSGEPSPRAFQSTFIRVDVYQPPDVPDQLLLQIEVDSLTIGTFVPGKAPPAELGRQAVRLFQVGRDRKF